SVLKANYDNASRSRELNVQNVQQAGGSRMLNVTWNNDTVSRFPFVFLRDNCQCSECFHESSLQRTYDTFNKLDMDIQPQRVEVLQNGEEISITWPDKHVSLFSSQWLRSRQATEQANTTMERSSLQREGVRVWNNNKLQGKIPSYRFQEVIEDDFRLYEWLHSLHSVGIALLKDTPRQPGECNQLCARVGYTKTTNFGYCFEVHTKLNANNLAYTSLFLPPHTDMPYHDYVPGVQLLHCIEQVLSEGGGNQFVDGFYVAEELKEKDPEAFKLLSTTRIPFTAKGIDIFGEFHTKFARHIIELDENENIVRFSCNNPTRDSGLHVSPEKTIQLYEAYLTIGKMIADPANQIEHKMSPGEVVTFNNSRVLHGRSSFIINKQTKRYLQGFYLDWDVIYSRLRVLAKQFNIPFRI
ncbi:unnamed protein product, partial [Porites lobata]